MERILIQSVSVIHTVVVMLEHPILKETASLCGLSQDGVKKQVKRLERDLCFVFV